MSAVLLTATVVFLVGVARKVKNEHKPGQLRLTFCAGFLVTAGLLFLGGIWPSYYTLVAILALPALFILGGGIFRPMWLATSSKMCAYVTVCVIASAICWTIEFVTLAWH
jgi:cation transport ATPase